jgi:hypothetical protein
MIEWYDKLFFFGAALMMVGIIACGIAALAAVNTH